MANRAPKLVDRLELSSNIAHESLTIINVFDAIEWIAAGLNIPDVTYDGMSARTLLVALAKHGRHAIDELAKQVLEDAEQTEATDG